MISCYTLLNSKGWSMFKKKPKYEVKVVRVSHGVFGRADTRRIGKTIEKWSNKGYRLDKQDIEPTHRFRPGYTLLTFIKEPQVKP